MKTHTKWYSRIRNVASDYELGMALREYYKNGYKEVGGLKLRLNLKDRSCSGNMLKNGVWEPEETKILKTMVSSSMKVIDVGANVGYFTVLMAQLVGNGGKVFAFEPEPSNYLVLEENITLNELEGIVYPYRLALGNEEKIVDLQIPLEHTVARIWDSGEVWRKWKVFPTPMQKLDSVIQDNIDFVKIDVEGADLDVLKGMVKIIEKSPNIKLMIEFFSKLLREYGTNPADLLTFLHEYNFRLKAVIGGNLRGISDGELLEMQSYVNLFAIRS